MPAHARNTIVPGELSREPVSHANISMAGETKFARFRVRNYRASKLRKRNRTPCNIAGAEEIFDGIVR